MSSQSITVGIAPSPRLRDTHATAPAELVQLRVQHLLPHTTRRAKARIDALKRVFATPTAALLEAQATAAAMTLHRLRLVKSVRNIKVQGGSGSGGSDNVVGALCLPLHACAALPALSGGGGASTLAGVLTGSVDGLLTLWDAERCMPLCSQSTYPEGRAWGRVRSIAVYPATVAGTSCVAFTASMFQREVRVWCIALDEQGEALQNEEATEGDDAAAAPSATLQPLTTASTAAVSDGSSGTTALPAVASPSMERQGGLHSVAVDATGALLAATHASGVVHLWDARTAIDGTATAPLLHLCAQDGYETAGATCGVAFHPDGSLLTTTDAGGRVVAWDSRSGQLAFHTGDRVGSHLRGARCVAWSPCGVRLASGGDDGVVQLYDARRLTRAGPGVHRDGGASTAPFLMLGHEDAVTSLSFYDNPLKSSSGGASVLPVGVVSTSLDATMRVWDADTGLCVRALEAGMPLSGHCRPSLLPLAADRFATSTAVMAVGHGKSWLLYDVGLRGDALDEDGMGTSAAAGVQVQETDIIASPHGAAGTMKLSLSTSGPAPSAGEGKDSSSEEEEEEEEDEMMALRKPTAAAAAPPPSAVVRSGKASESDEDEENSEDEMEALKRKAAQS